VAFYRKKDGGSPDSGRKLKEKKKTADKRKRLDPCVTVETSRCWGTLQGVGGRKKGGGGEQRSRREVKKTRNERCRDATRGWAV